MRAGISAVAAPVENATVADAGSSAVTGTGQTAARPAVSEMPTLQRESVAEKKTEPVQARAAAEQEQMPATSPAKPEQPVQSAPVETAPAQDFTPYGGEWAEGDEYWSKAMEVLKAERKNSIASCASHGYVLAYENAVLTIGFKMKFLCERLQKPDYRKVVEEVLLRIARVPVRLQCVVDEGGKRVGSKPASAKAAGTAPTTGVSAKEAPSVEAKSLSSAATPSLPQGIQVSDSTRKAMEMFNATLHKA